MKSMLSTLLGFFGLVLATACASLTATASNPGFPGPSDPAGRLVWVDDPHNANLSDGRILIKEGGRTTTLSHPTAAFPGWDPSDRLLSFQSGPAMVTITAQGTPATLPASCPGVAALSPDGTRFVTVSSDQRGLEVRSSSDLRVSRTIPILKASSSDQYPNLSYLPWWSPAGDRIAYTVYRGQDLAELWVCRADGTGGLRVNQGLTEGWGADWSPDGTKLAFYASGGIWVVKADGTGLRRVTPEYQFAAFPSWSPDGTAVAYQNNSAEGGADVWRVGADGSQPQLLVGGPGFQGQPAWGGLR